MKRLLVALTAALGVVLASAAFADEAQIKKALHELDPNSVIHSIKPSKINGLYEVVIGSEVYYASENGKYVFTGDIYDASTRKNITDITRGQLALKIISKVGDRGMIIYEPKTKVRQTLTVFTDVDCPYCRKFHEDLPQHLANGIRVRYVMFPLRGTQSGVYRKEVNVWCSSDRKKAFDTVKAGGSIKEKDCTNPILDNYVLAHKLGVDSTPTLMTEKGILIKGYLPPAHLAAQLGLAPLKQARK